MVEIDTTPESATVADCIENAHIPQETPEQVIKRLSLLTELEYELSRKEEARKLGITASALDKQVKSLRKTDDDFDNLFPEIEAWHEAVNGADLLDEINRTIRRFIVCNDETAMAAALWIVMTWFIDEIQVAPIAVITAPEKRCGKTQLLNLLSKLSCKSLSTSNITSAALYRTIEACNPTLFIDEADTFLKENEELRGVINAGHTRDTAHVIRTVGDNHTPKRFSVWGAKAISGIGKLQDTITDRSIILTLRRKLDCERVDRLRHAEKDLFAVLQKKICRFVEDNRDAIGQARPELPEALNDRAQDNWEPLLAIADVAGGHWPETARKTAIKISAEDESTLSRGVELLADIKEVLENYTDQNIFTSVLIEKLCEDDEMSWSTYNRGNPIRPRQLSKKLKEFEIKSKQVRVNLRTQKGYEVRLFDDVFNRYLPSPFTSETSETAKQVSNHAGFGVSNSNSVSDRNETLNLSETRKASVHADCFDVSNVSQNTGGLKKETKREFLL